MADLNLGLQQRLVMPPIANTVEEVKANAGILSERSTFERIEIAELVKDYVDRENVTKPHTDIEIANYLENHGYEVTRAEVAKYRFNLGIPASEERRRFL